MESENMFLKISEALKMKESSSLSIRGWIYRIRKLGEDKIFIVLRDSTGIIQCVVSKNDCSEKLWEISNSLYNESSIELSGILKKDERAPGGFELKITSIEKYYIGEPFPIQKDLSDEFLMDVRHLWLRSRKMQNIMQLRHSIINYMREYLNKNLFYEITPPIITTAGAEGGSEMFEFNYFGKKAYLTQSSQMYSEVMIFALERVYTLAPSFRAEKSRTRKHLTEFWHLEPEMAYFSQEDNMKLQENMIETIAQRLVNEQKDLLLNIGLDLEYLKKIKAPFKRLDYEDAIKKANENGAKMKYGEDFGADEEVLVTKGDEKPVFIMNWPSNIKAFYMKENENKPGTVLAADLIAPYGHGEIIGGSERIADYKTLVEKMKKFKLDLKQYSWYLDLRKYGSIQHSGFGLGIERFVKYLLDLEHIKDAIPFPRTMTRTEP